MNDKFRMEKVYILDDVLISLHEIKNLSHVELATYLQICLRLLQAHCENGPALTLDLLKHRELKQKLDQLSFNIRRAQEQIEKDANRREREFHEETPKQHNKRLQQREQARRSFIKSKIGEGR